MLEIIWDAMRVVCLSVYGILFIYIAARVVTRAVIRTMENKKECEDGQKK